MRNARDHFSRLLEATQSGAMYRDLYENAPDMMCSVCTASGRIVQCNRTLADRTGFTREEIIGRLIVEMYHPDCLKRVKAARNAFKRTGELRDLEFQLKCKDGSRLDVSLNVTAVRDASGEIVLSRCIWRDITCRKRVEAALRDSEKELRRLAGRLLSAQEEERRKLARELHDDLTQRLAMLALDASRVERLVPSSSEAARGELRQIRDRLTELSNEANAFSRQLHPSIVEDLGLEVALESECASWRNRGQLDVDLTASGIPGDLPEAVALCLYRVAQEGLRNVAKHAGCTEAEVTVKAGPGRIVLTVADRGAGFDRDTVRGRGGLGLVSMEERVRLIDGTLTVRSRPGVGTTIRVVVPTAAR